MVDELQPALGVGAEHQLLHAADQESLLAFLACQIGMRSLQILACQVVGGQGSPGHGAQQGHQRQTGQHAQANHLSALGEMLGQQTLRALDDQHPGVVAREAVAAQSRLAVQAIGRAVAAELPVLHQILEYLMGGQQATWRQMEGLVGSDQLALKIEQAHPVLALPELPLEQVGKVVGVEHRDQMLGPLALLQGHVEGQQGCARGRHRLLHFIQVAPGDQATQARAAAAGQ